MTNCPNCQRRISFIRVKDEIVSTHGKPMELRRAGADVVVPSGKNIRELTPHLLRHCPKAKTPTA